VNSPPQAQLESATREVLAGLVERVTFHNAENGFCVLRIKARGSFQGGSGRLDTRLDTPPSINRRHPNSCLAPIMGRIN
jgi:hypothetical protein